MAPHDKDQFDDLLDAALKRYGDVQPRPGLDGRVLAMLAQESHANWRRPCAWASAAAFACLLAVVVWIGVVDRTKPPHTAGNAAQVAIKENRLETAEVRPQINKPGSAGQHGVRKIRLQLANTTPRLEQFPSPLPLSEQEKLLVAYASEYPKQAAEVAQEQGKRDKELQAMYPVPGPDSNQER